MKSINQIFATVLSFVMACLATTNLQAADGQKVAVIKGGTIYYSLHIGKDIISTDTMLTDESYIYTDKQSSIAIADPKERFHIGIVKAGAFKTEKISQNSKTSAYTLANYLVYDDKTKTMEAVPFETGFVNIKMNDNGCYSISFTYMLKDKTTGKLITLKGEARFQNQTLALQ